MTETIIRVIKILGKAIDENFTESKVDISASFLELGLKSFNAFKFIDLVNKEFKIELEIDILFEYPVLGDFCQNIDKLTGKDIAQQGQTFEVDQMLEDKERYLLAVDQLENKKAAEFIGEKNILITGASGFLGAFSVEQAMKQFDGKVYCLVRAKDEQEGRARLQKNFEKYSIDVDIECLEVICGDVTQDNLGVKSDVYEKLSTSVGYIIHCAAQVDHFAGYGGMRDVNVKGTFEVVKFAAKGIVKNISFASTIAVSLMSDANGDFYTFRQEKSINDGVDISGAYGKSKWVAEKILERFSEKTGASIHVFRIGEISGHSQTGAGRFDDIIHNLIHCFTSLAVKVPLEEAVINIVPVDFVTKIMVASLSFKSDGVCFINLSHPGPLDINEFLSFWLERELSLPVSKSSWLDDCRSHIEANKNVYLAGLPVFVESTKTGARFEMYFSKVDLAYEKLIEVASQCGVKIPDINKNLISIYKNNYLNSCGFK